MPQSALTSPNPLGADGLLENLKAAKNSLNSVVRLTFHVVLLFAAITYMRKTQENSKGAPWVFVSAPLATELARKLTSESSLFHNNREWCILFEYVIVLTAVFYGAIVWYLSLIETEEENVYLVCLFLCILASY